MNIQRSKKGAQGIGTLIIFIALILVAAVASGVLIQTAATLQSKSLDVGRQSQEKITIDVEVVQVYVTNTSDAYVNSSLDNFTIVARLGSGSSPIKLADLLLKLDSQDGSQTLTSAINMSETTYSRTFIINGTNHNDNYLVEGDLVQFQFTSSVNITESETVTVRLVAKNGAVKPIRVTTPAAMVESTTFLFP